MTMSIVISGHISIFAVLEQIFGLVLLYKEMTGLVK